MIVADTDVLIDYLRGAGAAERVELELRTGRLATTAVSAFELWAGAHGKRQEAAVDALLSALDVLPLHAAAARAAGAVRRDLVKAGAEVGMADSLIAGICLVHRAILLTRNRKHFERVAGLTLATLTLAG